MLVAGLRILLAYVVFYAALGAAYPFLPVFYRDLGLALDQIGLLVAIQAAIMLVFAPIWGGLSDRFPHSRVTLPLAAAVATFGATMLYLTMGFLAVLIASMVLFVGLAGVNPMLDARTLETLGSSARHRFGQVRAVGSLSFVIATLIVGVLLDRYGPRSLFWVYIPMLALTVIVTATIPRRGTEPIRQPAPWPGPGLRRARRADAPGRVHRRVDRVDRHEHVLLDPDGRPRRQPAPRSA